MTKKMGERMKDLNVRRLARATNNLEKIELLLTNIFWDEMTMQMDDNDILYLEEANQKIEDVRVKLKRIMERKKA